MQIDLSRLCDEDRYRILEYVVGKYGKEGVQRALGVSRVTMWRLLNRRAPVDDEKLKKLLSMISERELREVLGSRKVLEALGIVRDGVVSYSLVLEILRIAAQDEYLKNAILQFVVREFREDLKKMLGLSFAGIRLEWSDDFERFLTERKKRKKVRDPETVKYYRNIFRKYLEGKELSEELIDYVVNHPNKWLRNVFRHYIQYLYFKRRISPETFGWIMEVVPSRGYRVGIKAYRIDLEQFKRTMKFLKQNHELYYTYYLLMYFSGVRVEHVVKIVESWSPEEDVFIDMLEDWSKRLVCFEEKRFCRYFVGLRDTHKPCEWIYFPRWLLPLIERYRGVRRDRSSVSDYATRYDLLRPNLLRKLNWRVLEIVIPKEDVARFIQSRFGEIRKNVSKAVYSDLLTRSDLWYPDAMKVLEKGLEDVEYLKKVLHSKEFRPEVG